MMAQDFYRKLLDSWNMYVFLPVVILDAHGWMAFALDFYNLLVLWRTWEEQENKQLPISHCILNSRLTPHPNQHANASPLFSSHRRSKGKRSIRALCSTLWQASGPCPRGLSSLIWNIPNDGMSVISLGNPFLCLIDLAVKMLLLRFRLDLSFKPLLLVTNAPNQNYKCPQWM